MQNEQLVTENQSKEWLFTQQEINDMMRKRLVRARQQFIREMECKLIKYGEDDNTGKTS